MIITNFYDCAYLIQEGYTYITSINEKGKIEHHFNSDDELIQKDLDEFHDNAVLQSFVKGIVKLRRINKNYRKRNKNKGGTDKKATIGAVLEAELLCPVED